MTAKGAIYFSSGAFGVRTSQELIEQALAAGISHIELSAGMEYSPRFLDPIRAALSQLTYLIHNYFPPPENPFVLNLAATDDDILERSLAMCHNAIDLCVEFGTPFYSVHSGFAFDLKPTDLGKPDKQAKIAIENRVDYETAYLIFVESVKTLATYARSKSIRLLLENNVVAPTKESAYRERVLLMASADEYERLLADIADDTVGVLIDFGHLAVTANTYGFDRLNFVQRLAPYVGCLHMSDNDGQRDQNLPLSADTWFLPLLKDFRHIPVVIEAYNLTPDLMLQQKQIVLESGYG